MNLAPYRKFAVAALGVLTQMVAAGVIPAQYQPWVAIVIAAATALGVVATPNAPLTVPAGAPHHGEHVAPDATDVQS